jgi:pimeloyl-ACP methyl ester carboxylesterase
VIDPGQVHFARTADADIAYRVVNGSGSGTRDVLLLMGGTMPMDPLFEDPVALRFVEGLADLGRLVMFDRCGIGLSDPPPSPEGSALLRWVEDAEAVVKAASVVQPVIFCVRLSVGAGFLYCDRHPDEVSALVIFEPPSWRTIDWDALRAQIEGEIDSAALWCPSRAEEPGFREWFNRAGQRGASRRLARRAYPQPDDVALMEALDDLRR